MVSCVTPASSNPSRPHFVKSCMFQSIFLGNEKVERLEALNRSNKNHNDADASEAEQLAIMAATPLRPKTPGNQTISASLKANNITIQPAHGSNKDSGRDGDFPKSNRRTNKTKKLRPKEHPNVTTRVLQTSTPNYLNLSPNPNPYEVHHNPYAQQDNNQSPYVNDRLPVVPIDAVAHANGVDPTKAFDDHIKRMRNMKHIKVIKAMQEEGFAVNVKNEAAGQPQPVPPAHGWTSEVNRPAGWPHHPQNWAASENFNNWNRSQPGWEDDASNFRLHQ